MLDLDDPADREHFRQLAAGADLVLEDAVPGALERIGLGYADLARRHPGLVVTSISGFGQTGPQRYFASSDIVAAALGGAMTVIGSISSTGATSTSTP